MSVVPSAGNGKITVPSIIERKPGSSAKNPSPAKRLVISLMLSFTPRLSWTTIAAGYFPPLFGNRYRYDGVAQRSVSDRGW